MSQVHTFYVPKERSGIIHLLQMKRGLLNYFVNLMLSSGSHACYKILGQRVVLVNDLTAIRYLFIQNYTKYHKSRYNEVLRPVLGGGIFLSEDDEWKSQRQEAAPIFSNGRFPVMVEQMTLAAESMFKRWDKRISEGKYVDINLETMWYALDVALRCFFHQEKEEIAHGVQEHLGNLLRESESRIWSFIKIPQSWTMKLPKYKRSLSFLQEITSVLIDDRRQSGDYPDDLLSRAILACDNSPQQLKKLQDKVMSYLTSAHETTANAMAWAWYELGHRPEILERITEEVDSNLRGHKPSFESIKTLKYTQNVFSEILRLYPPVWTMSREALEDDKLPLDDNSLLEIRKGDTIMLSPYVMHRRECYWKNPVAFDPDRFSNIDDPNRLKIPYYPFGGGARLCLGYKFAQIEAAVLISMIVQRYEMCLVPGQNIYPEPMITLRPSAPVWFKATHREVTIEEVDETRESNDERPTDGIEIDATNTNNVCPFYANKY